MKDSSGLRIGWLIRIAWLEMRRNRLRLLLFVSAICFGVAAVVVVESFRLNLEEAVTSESKTLLGADLVVRSRNEFSEANMAVLDSLGGNRSAELRFSSMAFFPQIDEAKLVQVRAIDGQFPFYGEFLTQPANAVEAYLESGSVLVDNNLKLQLGVALGDTLKLGRYFYPIAGFFSEIPGEAATASMFSGPRIFLPLEALDRQLLDRGSRVNRRYRFKFDESEQRDMAATKEDLTEKLPDPEFRITNVEDASENLGNALRDLYSFLGIAGLVALLLGSIGIASSVYVYIKRKIPTIATMRCLGFSPQQCVWVFALQSFMVGVLSSIIGVLLGLALVSIVPKLLQDFIPIELSTRFRFSALVIAFFAGCGVALISSLFPLSRIRDVSPMAALRGTVSGFTNSSQVKRSFLFYAGIVVVAFWLLAVYLTGDFLRGLGLIGGVLSIIFILCALAAMLMKGLRKMRIKGLSYPFRQGISNLHRPNNQTTILLVVLGLGAFLIGGLSTLQHSLLGRFDAMEADGAPNTILFDIQDDQLGGVNEVLSAQGAEIVDEAPVVTMRLRDISGTSVASIRDDSTSSIPSWTVNREYRSTFRNYLKESEKVVAGEFNSWPDSNKNQVSIEESLAQDLNLEIGDELTFDVQGIPTDVVISSVREVNWFAFESNFFFVFDTGILELAPKFHVVLAKTESSQIPLIQRQVVKSYPNISVIDATTFLNRASGILDKLSLIVRVMALFCIFTGVMVLISSLSMSRSQRFRENALLRTLGAQSRQISIVNGTEYAVLGSLATFTGLSAAILGAWGLLRFVFEIELRIPWGQLVLLYFGILSLTVLIGFLGTRGTTARSPMEVLRLDLV